MTGKPSILIMKLFWLWPITEQVGPISRCGAAESSEYHHDLFIHHGIVWNHYDDLMFLKEVSYGF